MAKGEIIFNDMYCDGCGLCVHFCTQGCIAISKDRFNSMGALLPVAIKPDKCTGCGICGWMCPQMAIEVYKYVKEEAPSA